MSCAEDVPGLKICTEAVGVLLLEYAVAERSVSLRSQPVRAGGDIRSENADMSSDKEGEMPSHRKSKGSCAMLISAG